MRPAAANEGNKSVDQIWFEETPKNKFSLKGDRKIYRSKFKIENDVLQFETTR